MRESGRGKRSRLVPDPRSTTIPKYLQSFIIPLDRVIHDSSIILPYLFASTEPLLLPHLPLYYTERKTVERRNNWNQATPLWTDCRIHLLTSNITTLQNTMWRYGVLIPWFYFLKMGEYENVMGNGKKGERMGKLGKGGPGTWRPHPTILSFVSLIHDPWNCHWRGWRIPLPK